MKGDSHVVAQMLLGSCVCRTVGGRTLRLRITEVEVYDGLDDLASHASKGKTKRTEVMFGPAGYWYVYLCYGMHWMLNLVTREAGYPAAILIRAGIAQDGVHVTGPGRVTKFLHISKPQNMLKAQKGSGLWIIWRKKPLVGKIKKTPRIGVNYAGPIWSKKHWRYIVV